MDIVSYLCGKQDWEAVDACLNFPLCTFKCRTKLLVCSKWIWPTIKEPRQDAEPIIWEMKTLTSYRLFCLSEFYWLAFNISCFVIPFASASIRTSSFWYCKAIHVFSTCNLRGSAFNQITCGKKNSSIDT